MRRVYHRPTARSGHWMSWLAVLVLAPVSSGAMVERMQCERFAIEDGLSQLSITTAMQDSRGFLWFGTQAGLNRFDGYSFRVYLRQFGEIASLPDNYIQDLLSGQDGRIWVATLSGGLSEYDPRTDRFVTYQHHPDQLDSLSHQRLSSLADAGDGRIWVGTWGGGLNRFDPATGTAERWTYDPDVPGSLGDNGVQSLLVDRDGVLWVGTNGGLYSVDPSVGTFEFHPLKSQESRQPVVTSLAQTPDGSYWIGTEGLGLFRIADEGRVIHYRSENFDPTTLAHDQIGTLYVDQRGDLWVGTTNGLSVFDDVRGQFVSFYNEPLDEGSLPSNRVASIFEDRSGLLWFGTWTGGLCKLNTSVTNFNVYRRRQDDPRSIADNRVRDFYETPDGDIWVAMLGGGIARFDPTTESFQSFRHDPFYPNSIGSDDIHALAGDNEGFIWVGSRNAGLDRFDPRTGTAIRFGGDNAATGLLDSEHVLDLLVDDQQRLWVGTWEGGLAHLDIDTGQLRKYRYEPNRPNGLSSDSIGVLFQSRKGEIWIGTRGAGLLRYRPETDDFDRYTPQSDRPGGLSHGVITFITEDSDGEIWVATQGGGFSRMIRSGANLEHVSFRTQTHVEGLASDAVGAVIFDDAGRLWISTLVGISRFDPRDGAFANFFPIHGVQRSSYYVGAGIRSSTGEIYFGGIDGFTRFLPVEFPIDTTPPQVVITDLLISNQPTLPRWRDPTSPLETTVEYADQITFDHQRSIFSFEFAGLHFVEPSKNRYHYMLEGFDRDWVETDASRRYATYTDLDAGDYLFRVRATNRDGVMSENEAAIRVTILPPPWQTWWAYLGYLLAGGVIVGGVGLQRYRALQADRVAQAAIRESEENLKLALWGSGDEFWILNMPSRRFHRMSHGDSAIARREMIRVHTLDDFWRAINPKDAKRVKRAMSDHLEGKVPYFEALYRIKGKDNQEIWALSKGRVKDRDAKGNPINVSGASKDISALKQTEEALRELNEKLESMVEARTVDLRSANENLKDTLGKLRDTQNQLVEAEKMASLGGLVAGVAHEINTPLGVAVTAASHLEKEVRKMVSFLDEEDFDPEIARGQYHQQLQNTQFVLKNLRRAADLVRSFKQVAVDQSTEDQRRFNLNEYLHEILVSLRPRFKRTSHVVNIECPMDINLNSYPGAIYQVVTNLVMNSLIHGFDGIEEGQINIRVEQDGDSVIINYTDDGHGFGPEIEGRIFDPFFTTRRSQGGSGLGMHIVFNLVTQVLGGHIECQGDPGKGVRFTMQFPTQVSKELTA